MESQTQKTSTITGFSSSGSRWSGIPCQKWSRKFWIWNRIFEELYHFLWNGSLRGDVILCHVWRWLSPPESWRWWRCPGCTESVFCTSWSECPPAQGRRRSDVKFRCICFLLSVSVPRHCQCVRINAAVIYFQPFLWRCFPAAVDAERWGSLGVTFQFWSLESIFS